MNLLQRLRYFGKVSDLLTSKDKEITKQVAEFLVEIENTRYEKQKEETLNSLKL
jgi:hypothetical protein